MIPKEPGEYRLQDFVHWVFFNPTTKTYDTLKAQSVVEVRGESLKNEAIESVDAGSFYDRINSTDNTLHAISDTGWLKTAIQIFILVMLAGSAYLVFRK
jgi:hypothetical protein